TVFEIARDGQSERKNREREASRQVGLVGEERARGERIEALLICQIKHIGKRIEHALENGGAVKVGGRVEPTAASGISGNRARRHESTGVCSTAGTEKLNGTATIGGDGVEGSGEKRMVIEHAIAGADDGFAVAARIPSDADARGDVVVI